MHISQEALKTQAKATHNQIIAQKCKRSLSFFIQTFFPIVDSADYLHNWHIDVIAEHLQVICERMTKVKTNFEYSILTKEERDHIKNRLIINIPPGHMKSLMVNVFFQAWCWLIDPSLSYLNIALNEDLTIRDSLKMRRLVESDLYKSMRSFKLAIDQNSKSNFQNTEKGERAAIGITAGITGKRASAVFIDDPISALEAVKSEAKRNEVVAKFKTELYTRTKTLKDPILVIIMQRLHPEDLAGVLLAGNKERKSFTPIVLQSIFDEQALNNLGCGRAFGDKREYGDLLFEEYLDKAGLDNLRAETGLGEANFMAQYQQDPKMLVESLFKREHFLNVGVPPSVVDLYFMQMWDTAQKDGAKNDCTACAIIGRESANKIWLMDIVKVKKRPEELKNLILETVDKYQESAHNVHIEDTSSGTSIIDSLRSNFKGIITVHPVKPSGSKWERAMSVVNFIAAGNLWIHEDLTKDRIFDPYRRIEKTKHEILIADMINFIEGGENDDLVDAVVYAVKIMVSKFSLSGSSSGRRNLDRMDINRRIIMRKGAYYD